MNRLCKHWPILFMLVLLVLPMAACGRQDEPARVAEKFLRAAVANDLADLQETVDPDYQEEVMMTIFLQMGLSAFVGGAQGEYTELKVKTIANDGQRATVHATGKLKVVSLGTQMSVPVDVQIPLIKKQGRWYVTSDEVGILPTATQVAKTTATQEASVTPTATQVTTATPKPPALASAWTEYTDANRDVRALALTGDTLWVGGNSGVVRWNLNDKSYKKYGMLDGLLDYDVRTVIVDRDGIVWVGTREGVTALTPDGEATSYLFGEFVSAGCVDQDGNKWFPARPGSWSDVAFRLDRYGQWRMFKVGDYWSSSFINSIVPDKQGGIWFATSEGVEYLSNDGTWVTYTTSDGLINDDVDAVAVDHAGDTWFGTSKGANLRTRDGWWTNFTQAEGLASDRVSSIAIGPDNSVWFTHTSEQVTRRLPDGSWKQYSVCEESGCYYVYAIQIAPDGTAWVGTSTGVFALPPGETSWVPWRTADEPWDVNDTIADDRGNVWIATWGDGVVRLAPDGTRTTYTQEDGLISNTVFALAVAVNGSIWFGTNKGASRLTPDGRWLSYRAGEELVGKRVQKIAIGRDGSVWFVMDNCPQERAGSCEGPLAVNRLLPDRTWKYYTQEDGIDPMDVNDIAFSQDGGVWFAMESGVKCLLPDGRWEEFTRIGEHKLRPVHAIAFDAKGNGWFGTDFRLIRFSSVGDGVSLEEVYRLTRGQLKVGPILVDKDDNVWVVTNSTLSHLGSDGNWTNYLAPYSRLPAFNSLAVDQTGKLWMGMGFQGLMTFVPSGATEKELVEPQQLTRAGCTQSPFVNDCAEGPSSVVLLDRHVFVKVPSDYFAYYYVGQPPDECTDYFEPFAQVSLSSSGYPDEVDLTLLMDWPCGTTEPGAMEAMKEELKSMDGFVHGLVERDLSGARAFWWRDSYEPSPNPRGISDYSVECSGGQSLTVAAFVDKYRLFVDSRCCEVDSLSEFETLIQQVVQISAD